MVEIFKKHSYKFLWSSIVIYILLFSFLSLKKYYNFDYNVFDLAIFNQVFFNTSEGRWFEMTINLHNYLVDHFTPIILFLVPIYKLWPKPETLLILQSAILGLAAWPLYKISEYVSKDKLIALGVAILWLVNPFVHNANIFEFHLLPFAVFFIFWTFYFYQKNNFKLFLLFFVLSLIVREDISLILIGFSILSFMDKKTLKWKLSSLLLSIIYFIISLAIIKHFSLIGDYKFIIYYNWIFESLTNPIIILAHIFSLANLANLLVLFLPLLFLPLVKSKYLLLSLLPLMQFVLSTAGFNSIIYNTHYVLLLFPGIFIALLFVLNDIAKNKKFIFSRHIYKHKVLFKLIFIFSVIYFLIFLSPIKNILFYNYPAQDIKNSFLEKIDSKASIMTDLSLASQLSSRKIIYPLNYTYFSKGQFGVENFKLPLVDYLLIDFSTFFDIISEAENSLFFNNKNNASNFKELLEDYCIEDIKNSLVLFSYDCEKNDFLLYKTGLLISEKESVFKYDFTENNLRLSFQKEQLEDKKYLIRFYKLSSYFDMPLDYGLWSYNNWSSEEVIDFYYYLSDDIDSFQIFSWQGDNKLGRRKQVRVDYILERYSDIIIFR